MKQFQDFGLPPLLNEALIRMEYTSPTPIQEQTIPLALEGRDILGSAQTGTGKTAAFMLPLIARLLKEPQKTALVLTPTRELAAQVVVFTQKLLGRKSSIDTVLLIGGEPMYPQLNQLRKNPRIVIGTPGRVSDHLERGSLCLTKTAVFVLDEADRMLDMGFEIQIKAIAEHLPTERQTFLFSATLPTAIVRLTQQYLHNPERINVNSSEAPAANIQQDTLNVTTDSKFPELLKELDKRSGSVIIFVKTKFGTEKLSRNLKEEGHSTDFLHGDLRQNRRSKVIKNFRERKHRILIATDVAARGLDIPHIEHVINYDLPQCPEDYIHRIGRTARAGAKGFSLCLISPQDRRLWAAIQYMLDPKKNQRPAPERSGNGNRRGGGSFGNNRNGSRSSFFSSRNKDEDRGGFGRGRSGSGNGNRRGRTNFNHDQDSSSDSPRHERPSSENRSGRDSFEHNRETNRSGFNHARPSGDAKSSNGAFRRGNKEEYSSNTYRPKFNGNREESSNGTHKPKLGTKNEYSYDNGTHNRRSSDDTKKTDRNEFSFNRDRSPNRDKSNNNYVNHAKSDSQGRNEKSTTQSFSRSRPHKNSEKNRP